MLLHGQTEDSSPDYNRYPFHVLSFRVIEQRGKLRTFLNQMRFNLWCAFKILSARCDAVVAVALQSALGGAVAKRHNPALRFVYDCNELFLEMVSGRLKKYIWGMIEREVASRSDVILHAEQHRMQYFHSRYKTRAKPVLLENLPHYRDEPSRGRSPGPVKVVYLGGFAADRCCSEIVRAFAHVEPTQYRLDMIGFYPSGEYRAVLESEVARCKPGVIRVLPAVPNENIPELLCNYDVGLAFYAKTNLNNYYCAPNKIYDYIQSRVAIVTNDYPGLKAVVEHNKIGVCLPRVTPEAILNAVRECIASGCAERITDDIRKRYSWESQVDRYRAIFS